MKLNLLKGLLSRFLPTPTPEQIAAQLRQPHGRFARKVAEKMNESNESLYEFTLDVMQLANGETVLEIGFGNGRFFPKLFARALDLKISGIDFSPEMVKAAREYNAKTIAAGHLSLHAGNSNRLPFPDESFDKVFCINVVYFWEQPEQHLQEIYRVLKPGGKFYAVIRDKEVMEQMPFTRFGFTFYTEESWRKLVEENRFSFLENKRTTEPPFRVQGRDMQLSSQVLIAGKPVSIRS